MITESDSFTTYDLGKHYVILPNQPIWDLDEYIKKMNAVPVPRNFKYNSGTNDQWLSVADLRRLIKEFIDPTFGVN